MAISGYPWSWPLGHEPPVLVSGCRYRWSRPGGPGGLNDSPAKVALALTFLRHLNHQLGWRTLLGQELPVGLQLERRLVLRLEAALNHGFVGHRQQGHQC